MGLDTQLIMLDHVLCCDVKEEGKQGGRGGDKLRPTFLGLLLQNNNVVAW